MEMKITYSCGKFLGHLFTLSLKDMILSEDDPDPGKNEECYTELI